MQAIENQAIQTYSDNMTYFSKHHPELFKKLNLLEAAIEQTRYLPKYELEYKNNYFDVYIKESDSFLYGSDSTQFAAKMASDADFKKDSHAFETVPSYSNYNGPLLQQVVPIMRYVNENASRQAHMKKMHKCIFVGVGLGLHLSTVHKSFRPEACLIIEDDLELFKLSLFTTDYSALAKHTKLYFSVSETTDQFTVTINSFLNILFFHNRFIKFFYHPGHSPVKMKFIQHTIATQSFIVFPYDLIEDKFLTPLQYINRGYRVLNISKNLEEPVLHEKPVLLLAAGPSLQKNLEWVKQHQHKFIIVAVSATLKKLYAEGIVPDIVTHIDGFDASMAHYDDVPVETFLKDTIFLLGPFVTAELRERLPKEHIFFFESGTSYFENFGSLVTPCVGSTTMGLMLMLGVHRLYLLGLDLAFDQESGKTHIDGHVNVSEFSQDLTSLNDHMSLNTTTVPVQGNFRDHVFTSSILNISVQSIYRQMPAWKNPRQLVFNLNDGARLREAQPVHAEEVETQSMNSLEKNKLQTELLDLFKHHSAFRLSETDMLSMQKRLDHIRQMQRHIIAFQNASHPSMESFSSNLRTLASQLIMTKGRETDNASYVYLSYLQYTLPLIFDLFNTKEVLNPKKHIKKISKLFGTGVSEITQKYKIALEKFLDESTGK